MYLVTSGAAGSSASSEARHRRRLAVSTLRAALQHGLHVLMLGSVLGVLDALRLALGRVGPGAAKFTALQGRRAYRPR